VSCAVTAAAVVARCAVSFFFFFSVQVHLTMSYGGPHPWLATGGTYAVSVSPHCHSLLASLVDSGLLDPYALAFAKHAQPEGPLLARVAVLRTNWVNGPDMALQGLPDGAVKAAGYELAPNLFA